MNFRVIRDNPERAYNAAWERRACKRKNRKDINDRHHFSYAVKIGKSPRPPVRDKPMGWEPDSWKDL